MIFTLSETRADPEFGRGAPTSGGLCLKKEFRMGREEAETRTTFRRLRKHSQKKGFD